MLFGRAFERALAAYFLREDAAAVLFREWSACQNQGLHYSNGDTWDRMLQQGIQLLDRFCQDDRIRIRLPRRNLQIKFTRQVSGKNDFVAYVDAIGKLDGTRCLLEWKTTSSRYPEEPAGLLALDPQLVCYSWMTGISEVAQVVFVRKRLVEIQYFQTTHHGRSTPRIRRDCRGHDPASRIRAVSAPRRHSLPAEPVQHLPLLGAMPREA